MSHISYKTNTLTKLSNGNLKMMFYGLYTHQEKALLGLILGGAPSNYSTYTRSDIGYNTDSSEVPENIPMGDVSENTLKYFNYAGVGEFPTEVSQPYLSLRSVDNGPELAYIPLTSSLGTSYGITGLFEGVDTNNAVGRVVIEKFKTSDISSQQNILLTNTDTVLMWIEATTGLIKASDGTNTCESISGISVDTNYKIELVWDTNAFWIVLDDQIGTAIIFDGAFPTIGEFIKYSENGIYHTVRSVYFTDNLTDDVLRDIDYVPLTDLNDEIITK